MGIRLGETRTLADLLIMPIQRPPRYLMYLERIAAMLGHHDNGGRDDGGDDDGGGEGGGGDAAGAVARAAEVVGSSPPLSTCHAPRGRPRVIPSSLSTCHTLVAVHVSGGLSGARAQRA